MGGVYYIPWFQSIGAVPVNAAAADLYQTIKTGVASGSFVYDSIYCNYKLYEVEDYCLQVGLGARNNNVLCFNKDMWESLDEKTQQLFQECADEAKAEWAETALGYQDTLQTWIDEVTALGYDGAGIMSAYLQAGEELGYEWHFDTTPYIQ